jgi:hypothetical protein
MGGGRWTKSRRVGKIPVPVERMGIGASENPSLGEVIGVRYPTIIEFEPFKKVPL